jgi:hypothetical protein
VEQGIPSCDVFAGKRHNLHYAKTVSSYTRFLLEGVLHLLHLAGPQTLVVPDERVWQEREKAERNAVGSIEALLHEQMGQDKKNDIKGRQSHGARVLPNLWKR